MDLEKEFGVDAEKAEEGVWIPIGDDGAELLIAAMPNAKYDAFMEPHFRRYRRLGREVPEEIYEEAVARAVLLGWKNLKLKGQELKSTEEERRRALKEYPYFKRLVLNLAMDQANFRKEEREKEEKNSASGLSGPAKLAH